MTNTAKPIVWCGLLAGLLALGGILALTLFKESSNAHSIEVAALAQAPEADAAEDTPPEQRPDPERVPDIQESEHPITNRSVEDLLAGVMQARQRQDRAWLARAMRSTAGQETLTDEDLHAAHRQYLWVSVSRLWLLVEEAWSKRSYIVSYENDLARATFDVGGALGTVWFDFVRIDDAWYFEGV